MDGVADGYMERLGETAGVGCFDARKACSLGHLTRAETIQPKHGNVYGTKDGEQFSVNVGERPSRGSASAPFGVGINNTKLLSETLPLATC